eukprot:851021-Prorocentrum_minimum.AAC.1
MVIYRCRQSTGLAATMCSDPLRIQPTDRFRRKLQPLSGHAARPEGRPAGVTYSSHAAHSEGARRYTCVTLGHLSGSSSSPSVKVAAFDP